MHGELSPLLFSYLARYLEEAPALNSQRTFEKTGKTYVGVSEIFLRLLTRWSREQLSANFHNWTSHLLIFSTATRAVERRLKVLRLWSAERNIEKKYDVEKIFHFLWLKKCWAAKPRKVKGVNIMACAIGDIAKRTSERSRWEEPGLRLANFNGGFLRFANGALLASSSAPAPRFNVYTIQRYFNVRFSKIYIHIYTSRVTWFDLRSFSKRARVGHAALSRASPLLQCRSNVRFSRAKWGALDYFARSSTGDYLCNIGKIKIYKDSSRENL